MIHPGMKNNPPKMEANDIVERVYALLEFLLCQVMSELSVVIAIVASFPNKEV